VEWPTGHYPPRRCQFTLLPDSQGQPGYLFLLVAEAPAGSEPVRVRWGTRHVASDAQWTLPTAYEPLLAKGAYAYACLAYATPQSDNFRYQDGQQGAGVDTSMVAESWWRKGQAALAEFQHGLAELSHVHAATGAGRVVWAERGDEER